jgi:hypothetical protein
VGRHFIQLVQVAIGVGITEPSADRLINKQQVGELIPRTLVVFQCLFVFESVGANLHQRTIHRAASGPTIQPNDGSLPIRNMLVLEVPEEEVAVARGVYFDVSTQIIPD